MAKRVLTVDDSKSVRQLISFALQTEGYEVVEAADGREALELLENQRFDLIFTDLNMPVMDGIALIRSTRARPDCRFIPIVMLTTESADTRKQEGKEAGATGWIVKPFQPELLTSVVKRLVG